MCAIGCRCALESDVLQGQKGISKSEVRELIYPSVLLQRQCVFNLGVLYELYLRRVYFSKPMNSQDTFQSAHLFFTLLCGIFLIVKFLPPSHFSFNGHYLFYY